MFAAWLERSEWSMCLMHKCLDFPIVRRVTIWPVKWALQTGHYCVFQLQFTTQKWQVRALCNPLLQSNGKLWYCTHRSGCNLKSKVCALNIEETTITEGDRHKWLNCSYLWSDWINSLKSISLHPSGFQTHVINIMIVFIVHISSWTYSNISWLKWLTYQAGYLYTPDCNILTPHGNTNTASFTRRQSVITSRLIHTRQKVSFVTLLEL